MARNAPIHQLPLRMPIDTYEKIATIVFNKKKTNKKYSANTWINEAIEEKLENKTCNNCKSCEMNESNNFGFCTNDFWKVHNTIDGNLFLVNGDFGCNNWGKL